MFSKVAHENKKKFLLWHILVYLSNSSCVIISLLVYDFNLTTCQNYDEWLKDEFRVFFKDVSLKPMENIFIMKIRENSRISKELLDFASFKNQNV